MASQPIKFGPLPPEIQEDPQNRGSEVRRKETSLAKDFELVRERVDAVLANRLVHGYRLGVQTLESFGLDDWDFSSGSPTSSIPSLAEVMSQYTDEDLKLLEEYQKPTVVIRPPRKDYKELIGALAYHYQGGVQNGPLVTEQNSFDWSRADSEYRPFIVEAVSEIQPKRDILSQALGGRMARQTELAHPSEFAMTNELYLMLVMQSIVRGQMIDRRRTFTILNGEAVVADRYVPTGHCSNLKPSLDWLPIESSDAVRGRFRRVLRGSKA